MDKMKTMNLIVKLMALGFSLLVYTSCEQEQKELIEKIVPVNPIHFIKENLVQEIEKVEHKLSRGTIAMCYKVVTKSEPNEHQMGPWCPRHINDSKEKGGIWFDEGKVYDVDGHFISNIGEFYADAKWKLYNEDGSIKVTLTQEQCEGAAKPNVEEIYKNHCVEC